MLVVGARGFAKEVLEVLYQLDWLDDLVFYDDVNQDAPEKLYDRFPVLTNTSQAEKYLHSNDPRFVLGIGGPHARHKLTAQFEGLGGILTTVVSPKSEIGHFGTSSGRGTVVMTGAIITNDVTIGEGVLINKNCVIGHDCSIGDFAEISPGVCMAGRSVMGSLSAVGMGSILMPGVNIGDNTVIGAGAVVTRDIPSCVVALGIPARVVRENVPWPAGLSKG